MAKLNADAVRCVMVLQAKGQRVPTMPGYRAWPRARCVAG